MNKEVQKYLDRMLSDLEQKESEKMKIYEEHLKKEEENSTKRLKQFEEDHRAQAQKQYEDLKRTSEVNRLELRLSGIIEMRARVKDLAPTLEESGERLRKEFPDLAAKIEETADIDVILKRLIQEREKQGNCDFLTNFLNQILQ